MAKQAVDPTPIFEELKSLIAPYAGSLKVVKDGPDYYYLDTHQFIPSGLPLFFSAVKIQKNYVSFYFMPVYSHPQLLEGASAELKKRMQGKSCFNFKQPDPTLFAELRQLVDAGFSVWKSEGKV